MPVAHSQAQGVDLPAATEAPQADSLRGLDTLRCLVGPTLERFRAGEGALFLVNVAWLLVSSWRVTDKAVAAVLSLISIIVLYCWNDLADAEIDGHNPRKNLALVQALFGNRSRLQWLVGVLTVLQSLTAWLLLGPGPATSFAAVAIVNVLYSAWFKRVPVLDVLTTGAWGALFISAVMPPARVILMIGLMTAASHIFQIRADRQADLKTGVTTTAAVSRRLPLAVLTVLCVSVAATAGGLSGLSLAMIALLPVGFAVFISGDQLAWNLTRAAYGVVYVAVLWTVHARG
jgi:4-hydroxybenzoate polyprenyltransferase